MCTIADSVEQLAYDEAVRGVEAQRQSLDALRARTGTLVAAAALVTTFIGGRALRGENSVWSTIAIVAFVGLAVCAFLVLLPWRFRRALAPFQLVRDYVDAQPQATTQAMLRDLAIHHGTTVDQNRPKQELLSWSFRAAIILLGFEVIAWVMELETES